MITTRSGRHRSSGSFERRLKHVKSVLFENLEGRKSPPGRSRYTQGIAGIITRATNGQLGTGGFTAGQGLFGRAARTPMPAIDTVDFLDLAKPVASESSVRAPRIGLVSQFRDAWLKREPRNATKRAYRRAPRVSREQEAFNGQSVYFWKQDAGKTPQARQTWRGLRLLLVVGEVDYLEVIVNNKPDCSRKRSLRSIHFEYFRRRY